jgi:hypothetical protein
MIFQQSSVQRLLNLALRDIEKNKKLFDRLFEQQAIIEKEYCASLTWERLDDKLASRIAVYREGSIEAPAGTVVELRQWSIENLLKLRMVLLPKVKAILNSL